VPDDATVILVILISIFLFEILPGNSLNECKNGSLSRKYPNSCENFCGCIYNQGKPLDKCLEENKQIKERESIVNRNKV
jgi:hypothetical protein